MLSRVLSYAVALATVVATLAGLPAPASAAAADPVRLETNGFGHGHGMSQYGAQARALRGHTAAQILRFYYPGLANGTTTGSMKVLISADTSSDVAVVDRAGLRVRSLGNGKTYSLDSPKAAKRWRITAASSARSTLSWRAASGSWRYFRTLPGQAEISAPGGQPVTLVTPTGSKPYRGALRSAWPSTSTPNTRDTVNVVTLESYLRGVVPRESPAYWEPAALQAQAIAARTYAAFEREDNARDYVHVDDTTSSQVYGGAKDEQRSTDAAIAATSRKVLTSGGKPAFTQFSASNGGWMSAGSRPYLVAKQDPYDDRFQGVTDSIAASEFERALPAIGTFQRLASIERDGNGQWGGRVISIQVVGSRATSTLTGDRFRSFFGLNSTWINFPS